MPNVGLCAEAHEPGFVLNPTIASTLLRKARPFLFFPHQSKLNSDWIMRRGGLLYQKFSRDLFVLLSNLYLLRFYTTFHVEQPLPVLQRVQKELIPKARF